MGDSAGSWFIVKSSKIFWIYIKHILIFPHESNREI